MKSCRIALLEIKSGIYSFLFFGLSLSIIICFAFSFLSFFIETQTSFSKYIFQKEEIKITYSNMNKHDLLSLSDYYVYFNTQEIKIYDEINNIEINPTGIFWNNSSINHLSLKNESNYNGNNLIWINEVIAENNQINYNDQIVLIVNGEKKTFTVSGIYSDFDILYLFSFDLFESYNIKKFDSTLTFSSSESNEVYEKINHFIYSSNDEISFVSSYRNIKNANLFLLILTIILIFVAVLIVMNALSIHFYTKLKSVSIWLIFGCTTKKMFLIYCWYAFFIIILAFILSLVSSCFSNIILTNLVRNSFPMFSGVKINLVVCLITISIIILIIPLFLFFKAKKVSDIEISKTMKGDEK